MIRIPQLVADGRISAGDLVDVQVRMKHPNRTGLARPLTAAQRQAAADPSIAAREAQRAAAEEAAAQERKERVRKAREAREAEERVMREKRQGS